MFSLTFPTSTKGKIDTMKRFVKISRTVGENSFRGKRLHQRIMFETAKHNQRERGAGCTRKEKA